jgi:hypothetical protein
MTSAIKLLVIGAVAPACAVVGKLLLIAVIVVAALAYLTICAGRALQATTDELTA